ncbi:hypothetical protein ACFV4N_25280 [Actinosynnema sp. NPDC059797]
MFRPVPVPALPPSTALADLATAGEDHAWLVGTTGVFTSRPSTPLVLRWTGAGWHEEPLPALPAPASLAGVAATAPDDVWAVGNSSGRPLVLHYDGATWRATTTPPMTWAKAVAAAAPDDVWLAHVRDTHELRLHRWNGSAWHEVPSPDDTDRLSVHGVAAGWTWGVRAGRGSFETRPAFHRWTGAGWAPVPLPDPLAGTSASHVGLTTTGATTWAYLKTAAGVHVLRHTAA